MFGHRAFGDGPFVSLSEPCVLVGGCGVLSIDFNYRIYAATDEIITGHTDTPPDRPFSGTIGQPLSFNWSILGSAQLGQFTTGQGTLTLVNTDGRYDSLPASYAVDGREILVKMGRVDTSGHLIDAYADFVLLAKLTATGFNPDESFLTINLVDLGYKLDVPLQPNLYGGTGGADGGSDLTGKRIPVAFGDLSHANVSPPLINAGLLIYQLNDGPISSIVNVYDRGAALTPGADYATYALLAAAAVSAGTYATSLAKGLFKLGSSPAGTVTADLKGDASSTGYIETTATIARRVLRNTVLVDPDDIYLPAFTAVDLAQPAPIGYFADHNDTSTVADCISRIMTGIGGWGGFRRSGKFEVGLVLAPDGSIPSSRFGENDILDRNITRQPLPSNMNPPPWRVQVGYQRNETVQTDLAGAVSATRKAFVAEQYRASTASSTAIKVDHPQARDLPIVQSYFANQADAQTEATRLLALFRATRALYKLKLNWPAFDLNIGEVTNITYPRWDLSVGRLGLIVSLALDARAGTSEIIIYG